MWCKSSLLLSLFLIVSCQITGQEVGQLNFRAPNAVEDKAAQEDYAVELQIGDRSYVESVLLQVFDAKGTSAESYILSDIYSRVEFGGACDIYSSADNGTTTSREFPKENCYTGVGIVQPSNSNPMRFSLTTNVCERLVADSARMAVIRNKIFTDKQWRKPDDVSVNKAWGLFFPTYSADSSIVRELKELGELSGSDENAWKHIVLTMCISPAWQVL